MQPVLARIPLWLALVPLGGYVLAVGLLQLRRRPMALSGTADLGLLAAGCSGIVAAGPLALLGPVIGPSAWAEVAAVLACVVGVAVLVLATRPRMVVYNVTIDQLRPMLAEVVGRLDAGARWAGETVVLPSRGLQLHLDGRGAGRCVSVVALGSRTSPEGWLEFSRRLRRSLQTIRVRRSPWGWALAVIGAAILTVALVWPLAARSPAPHPSPAATAASRPIAPSPEPAHAGARRPFGP